MDGIRLYQELERKISQLDVSVRMLRDTGADFAQAERDYQLAKREACLRLKSQGYAVGMISMMVKGEEAVARANFERMSKEAIYKANQEAIMSLKLQIRVLNDEVARAYGTPSAGVG